MEYTGLAWAAVGFSADGMMVGSDAVIGLPDDQTVLEYDLADKVREEAELQRNCGC